MTIQAIRETLRDTTTADLISRYHQVSTGPVAVATCKPKDLAEALALLGELQHRGVTAAEIDLAQRQGASTRKDEGPSLTPHQHPGT
jgi:hypothetical protein